MDIHIYIYNQIENGYVMKCYIMFESYNLQNTNNLVIISKIDLLDTSICFVKFTYGIKEL